MSNYSRKFGVLLLGVLFQASVSGVGFYGRPRDFLGFLGGGSWVRSGSGDKVLSGFQGVLPFLLILPNGDCSTPIILPMKELLVEGVPKWSPKRGPHNVGADAILRSSSKAPCWAFWRFGALGWLAGGLGFRVWGFGFRYILGFGVQECSV